MMFTYNPLVAKLTDGFYIYLHTVRNTAADSGGEILVADRYPSDDALLRASACSFLAPLPCLTLVRPGLPRNLPDLTFRSPRSHQVIGYNNQDAARHPLL
jgi:hypothetical protein